MASCTVIVIIFSERFVVPLLKREKVVIIEHRLDYAARPRGGHLRAVWRTLPRAERS